MIVFALCGCAGSGPVAAEQSTTTNAWQAPSGAVPAPLSTEPGRYNFSGLTVNHNGEQMDALSALNATVRTYELALGQITPQAGPIRGSVRIVLPDHDRLRVLALQAVKQPGGSAVDFWAENARLGTHMLADVVIRSHEFTSTTLVEQNDTVAPDAAGADYLLWFMIRSATNTNVGPWAGRWQFKRAGSPAADVVGVDPGAPLGPARLLSFVQSVRLAVAHQNGGSVASSSGASGSGASRHLASSGSGIVLDASGHVLTNNHVVATCSEIHVIGAGGSSDVGRLVAADAANDLALLKTERRWPAWASFRDSRGLRPGEALVVTGFPLAGLVSPEMAVTTGSLTALAGARGDTRQLQFSAPIQPGNSGGPVMDETGRVIGVASSMLNGLVMATVTGALPQNVNFAIKTDTVREFLDANQVTLDTSSGHPSMNAATIGDIARKFTIKIDCLR